MKSKFAILSFSVVLFLVFILSILLSGITTKTNDSTYTVYSDDEYYSETTYYLNETAYNNYLQENSHIQTYATTSSKSVNSVEKHDGEFVIATKKRLWVAEQEDENRIVTDSRLLTKSEIEELIDLNSSGEKYINSNVLYSNVTPIPTSQLNSELIGSDSQKCYYLDIDMTVYLNSDNSYQVTGHASWTKILISKFKNYKAAEEHYWDYIGLTWGGEGLLCNNPQITGKYYNGNPVKFSRQTSDSYAGFVWQFNEKEKVLGKEMEDATARVNLIKQGNSLDKYTCAKLTYIHTYGKINGTISLSASSNKTLAASISLSNTEKQWKIETSVGGIKY